MVGSEESTSRISQPPCRATGDPSSTIPYLRIALRINLSILSAAPGPALPLPSLPSLRSTDHTVSQSLHFLCPSAGSTLPGNVAPFLSPPQCAVLPGPPGLPRPLLEALRAPRLGPGCWWVSGIVSCPSPALGTGDVRAGSIRVLIISLFPVTCLHVVVL